MDFNGEHHVPRIGDGVTASTLHERATAVAVPDFNYLEQCVEAIAAGLTGPRRHRGRSGKQAGADAAQPNGLDATLGPAVIAVVRGRDETRSGWRLVSRTGSGADVLASAGVNPGLSCHEALQRLCAGDGTLGVLRAPNAHFTWTLNDPGGAVVAESPAVHRDAETCRRAFADAQRAACSALSGFGHERHAG